MATGTDSNDEVSGNVDAVPDPPPGYLEESTSSNEADTSQHSPNPAVADEMRQIDSEMEQESGQLTSEIERRHASRAFSTWRGDVPRLMTCNFSARSARIDAEQFEESGLEWRWSSGSQQARRHWRAPAVGGRGQ